MLKFMVTVTVGSVRFCDSTCNYTQRSWDLLELSWHKIQVAFRFPFPLTTLYPLNYSQSKLTYFYPEE